MNAAGWIGFAPIVDKTAMAFQSENVGLKELNYMSYIFMVSFLPLNYPSVSLIEAKGIRFSLLLAVLI